MRVHVVRVCEEDSARRTEVGNAATVVVVPPGNNVVPLVRSTDTTGYAEFQGLRIGVTYSVDATLFGDSSDKGAIVSFDKDGKVLEVQMPYTCDAVTGATGGTR